MKKRAPYGRWYRLLYQFFFLLSLSASNWSLVSLWSILLIIYCVQYSHTIIQWNVPCREREKRRGLLHQKIEWHEQKQHFFLRYWNKLVNLLSSYTKSQLSFISLHKNSITSQLCKENFNQKLGAFFSVWYLIYLT